MKSVYYYIIPAVLILILATYSVYQLYRSKTGQLSTSPSPTSSPVGFFTSPEPSVSASPILGANSTIPNSQPESGFNTQEIKNVGIVVDAPQDSSVISSPVLVSGKANVFEGNIQIRVTDAHGKILGQGSATACMDVDACPFEAQIGFSEGTTPKGQIEVFSPSPIGDNSEDYKQTINVLFK